MRFKRVEGDYGLYVIWNTDVKCIIALYVDDLLLAYNSMVFMTKLKKSLHNEYEMKDLGEAKFVLGIGIERDRGRRVIYLNQHQYIDNVLERFNMSECKPASTPMDVSVRLTKSQAMSINTLMQVNVEAPSECVCTVCVAQRSPRLGMQHRADALLTRYINCTYKGLSLYKFAAKTAQV